MEVIDSRLNSIKKMMHTKHKLNRVGYKYLFFLPESRKRFGMVRGYITAKRICFCFFKKWARNWCCHFSTVLNSYSPIIRWRE